MTNKFCLFSSCLLLPLMSFAQTSTHHIRVSQSTSSHADSLRGGLGPMRTCYDVTYYDLSIKIDPQKHLVSGSNDMTFKATRNTAALQIDLFSSMSIKSISMKGHTVRYTRDGNAVFVLFEPMLIKNSTSILHISYFGSPQTAKNPPWDGGFTWKTDTSGNPWVGVSCQGTGASMWWPNKDHQSDEPDSMMIRVSVPNGLKEISNGRLVNTVDEGNGFTRFDWFVQNPINNYDVTVNIGNYIHFSENFQDLSCDYYVLAEHEQKARKQFTQVKTMLTCFVSYFGPYPFIKDGFKLIESSYLGMEHQSAIAYGNHFMNGYLGSDLSGTGYGKPWDYIIVHESAHEWFGNNITTKDIADMWVHESFATYAESLFVEYTQGYSHGQDYLYGLRARIQNDYPCIGPYGVNKEGSGDMYFKGANLLGTVRHILANDTLWFSILKGLNTYFRHQTVNGSDVVDYLCLRSGINLRPIFFQYLHTVQVPQLRLSRVNPHELKFKWDSCQKNFSMPVDLILPKNKVLRIFPKAGSWKTVRLDPTEELGELRPDLRSYYIRWAGL